DGEDRLHGEADETLHRARISYGSDGPLERNEGAKSAQVDARLRSAHDDLREDALAFAAAEDYARAAEDMDRADLLVCSAGVAGAGRRGHLGAEGFVQQACDRVAVEHEFVHLSASCRSEAFRPDAIRLVSEAHERCRHGFDERRRAADIDVRA